MSVVTISLRKVGEKGQNLGVDLVLDPEVLKGTETDIHEEAEGRGIETDEEGTKRGRQEEGKETAPLQLQITIYEPARQDLNPPIQELQPSVKIPELVLLKIFLAQQELSA